MTSLILIAAWLGSFCATVIVLVVMSRREPPEPAMPFSISKWLDG